MKSAYPIVKYPKNIERKLKERSTVLSVVNNEEDNRFDFLFPPVSRQPARYPGKILWGVFGVWLMVLGGIALKLMTTGIFVGALVLSGIGLGVAARQIWIDSKVIGVKNDRAKVLPEPVTPPKKSGHSPIDWTENIKELTRSKETSTAQVGVSEKRFLGQLIESLPGKITFGHVYLPAGYSRPYSADIELILSNGLGLQIEIDEPYVGTTREPHHCWDNDKDTKRDYYFLDQGWVIIRFSEWQVVTNPGGCCGAIAAVIIQLTDDRSLTKLAELGKGLEPDSQWSAQQSSLMEKLKTREKYLRAAGLWNQGGKKK